MFWPHGDPAEPTRAAGSGQCPAPRYGRGSPAVLKCQEPHARAQLFLSHTRACGQHGAAPNRPARAAGSGAASRRHSPSLSCPGTAGHGPGSAARPLFLPSAAGGLRDHASLAHRGENGAPARAPPPRAAPPGQTACSPRTRCPLAPAGTAPPPPRARVPARTDLLGGCRRHLPPPPLPLPLRRGRGRLLVPLRGPGPCGPRPPPLPGSASWRPRAVAAPRDRRAAPPAALPWHRHRHRRAARTSPPRLQRSPDAAQHRARWPGGPYHLRYTYAPRGAFPKGQGVNAASPGAS